MVEKDLEIEELNSKYPSLTHYRKWNGKIGVKTVNEEPTMTQQQFQEQCDINHIMAKYEQGESITHINRQQGFYADVSEYTDYQVMLQKIQDADDAFNALGAPLRKYFDNDPAKMIDFLSKPENYEKAKDLGLIEPKKKMVDVINAEAAETIKRKKAKKVLVKEEPSDK